jgi:hypothetical protein
MAPPKKKECELSQTPDAIRKRKSREKLKEEDPEGYKKKQRTSNSIYRKKRQCTNMPQLVMYVSRDLTVEATLREDIERLRDESEYKDGQNYDLRDVNRMLQRKLDESRHDNHTLQQMFEGRDQEIARLQQLQDRPPFQQRDERDWHDNSAVRAYEDHAQKRTPQASLSKFPRRLNTTGKEKTQNM